MPVWKTNWKGPPQNTIHQVSIMPGMRDVGISKRKYNETFFNKTFSVYIIYTLFTNGLWKGQGQKTLHFIIQMLTLRNTKFIKYWITKKGFQLTSSQNNIMLTCFCRSNSFSLSPVCIVSLERVHHVANDFEAWI